MRFTLSLLVFLLCQPFVYNVCAMQPGLTEFEPLPIEILDGIESIGESVQIKIVYADFSNIDPESNIRMGLKYHHDDNVVTGFGVDDVYTQEYDHIFTDPQPFWDILNYIEQYPDVFFDYSEFETIPQSHFLPPEGGVKTFGVEIIGDPYGDSMEYNYCIVKWAVEGEPVSDELQYVFDTLQTEFMDELVTHPVQALLH